MKKYFGGLSIVILFLISCGQSPKITEFNICDNKEQGENYKCDNYEFPTDGTKDMFFNFKLDDAPYDTKVNIKWYYYGSGEDDFKPVSLFDTTIVFQYGATSSTGHSGCSLKKPKNGWEKGNYNVDYQIQDAEGPGTGASFSYKMI